MKWNECNSIEDLQKIGSYKEVKFLIKKELPPYVCISARSWSDILKFILYLQGTLNNFQNHNAGFNGFISEQEKYLFCLTRLDGANRQDLLGITRTHYSDPVIAEKWYKKIAQKIHPDKSSDSRAELAFKNLTRMYAEMSK